MEEILRKLAKSTYFQNLYNSSKENSGINLFQNNYNLSGLQVRFLYWLKVYDMLYTELQTYENDLLTEKVINDIMRCDAYLLLRSKKNEAEWKNYRKDEKVRKQSERRERTSKGEELIPIDIGLRRD